MIIISKINKSLFIKDWKENNIEIFKRMYPELTDTQISNVLDDIIDKNIINPKAIIHNNYIHKSINVDLISVYDWIKKTKPIIAGFGVFFKNQDESLNPAAVMLENFMSLRKEYKGQLKKYSKDDYEYGTFDRLQGSEKVNANSFYGASGAPTSNFFNIYIASAVTNVGQSLISTAEMSFETFLGNNAPFNNLEECIFFISNVIKEKRIFNDNFLENISLKQLMKYLKKRFFKYKEEYNSVILNYLMTLSQKDINRIYYKNNILEFSKLRKIRNMLSYIIENTDTFKNPSNIPKNIKEDLELLWEYYKEFVFFNFSPYNRIRRLKYDKRKIVVGSDTDSTILTVDDWVKFIRFDIINVNDKLINKDKTELKFISINILAYIITNMVTDTLKKYTKNVNIPKRYRPKINMKNEFLFTRLILTQKKKRYIASIRLREGEELYPEKIDIKGLDFVKSSTREATEKFFKNLIKEHLLSTEEINISNILKELEKLENMIRLSLQSGEKEFLIPKSVKELEAYKDPLREMGVRAVLAWNFAYPDNTIELPEHIDIIKVNMDEESIEKIKQSEPEIYERIIENIYHASDKKIREKGVKVIGLPRNIPKIPDWIIPFIDYNTIINNNLSTFHGVLDSLGIATIKTTEDEYHSNILRI